MRERKTEMQRHELPGTETRVLLCIQGKLSPARHQSSRQFSSELRRQFLAAPARRRSAAIGAAWGSYAHCGAIGMRLGGGVIGADADRRRNAHVAGVVDDTSGNADPPCWLVLSQESQID